jgi:Ca2+-binding EF-hand superfamily protein
MAAGAFPGGPPGGGNRPDPAARIKELDKNGDGKLSKDEVADDRMAARFDMIDADADGLVTLDEMKAASARFRAGGGAGGPPPGGN